MNHHAPFDDHVRKQLGDLSPKVPPHIWENISARNKKRPGGVLFFLQQHGLKIIVPFLLIAGTAVYYFNRKSNDTTGTLNALSLQQNTIAKKSIGSSDDQHENNGSNLNNSDQANSNNSTTTTIHSSNPTVHNDDTKNNSVSNTSVASSDNTGNKPVIQNATNVKPATNRRIENALSTKRNIRKNTASKSAMSSQPGSIDADNTNHVDVTPANSNNNEVEAAQSSLQKAIFDLNTISKNKDFNPGITTKPALSLNIPCPKAEKNTAGNKRYFELYAGPDYVFRSFSDTANSVYKEKRKESTSFSSAFSAGFRFTKVFSNGISFRSGLNYSQVNEKFKFIEGNIIQIVYITNQVGDTTGSYEARTTRYKTTHNKFRTLDLPLLIGYEMGNGRLHTNINAGAVVNIRSWQTGDVLDKTFQPVNINSSASPSPYQYRTNIGFGFLASVSLYYKLNNRIHLLGEPYFRYNFSPMSKSELTFKQKYSTAGLRIGVRYDF